MLEIVVAGFENAKGTRSVIFVRKGLCHNFVNEFFVKLEFKAVYLAFAAIPAPLTFQIWKHLDICNAFGHLHCVFTLRVANTRDE